VTEEHSKMLKELILSMEYDDLTYHDFLARMVENQWPRKILEVGVHKGSSIITMLLSGWEMTTACVIDDFQIGGRKELEMNLDRFGLTERVTLVEGNDLEKILEVMKDFQPEFVHLDAQHSFEGVCREFELVADASIKPEMVVIHDHIDNRVKRALGFLLKKYGKEWRFKIIKNVFNEAILIERREEDDPDD